MINIASATLSNVLHRLVMWLNVFYCMQCFDRETLGPAGMQSSPAPWMSKCPKRPTTRWERRNKVTLGMMGMMGIMMLLDYLIAFLFSRFSRLIFPNALVYIFNHNHLSQNKTLLYSSLQSPFILESWFCPSLCLPAWIYQSKAATNITDNWGFLFTSYPRCESVEIELCCTYIGEEWHVGGGREDLPRMKDGDKKLLHCEMSFSCM